MTFYLEFDSEQTQQINLLRTDVDTTKEYELELDSDTNGTTEPFDGTQLYPKGTNVGINAVPNTDYRFDKWVINGKEVFNKITNVIMNNGVRAFANFLSTVLRTINIIVSGNGTTTPAPDTYQEYNDQEFTVTAIPDNDETEFDKFNINGTETTDNPINITITEDLNIVAFFSTIGAYILNTFNYGIEKVVDLWYWINDSNSSMVQITDTQVLTFDGSGDCADTGINGKQNTIWVIKGRYTISSGDQFNGNASSTGRIIFGIRSVSWALGWGDSSPLAGSAGSSDTLPHTFILYDKRLWVLDISTETTNESIDNIINTVTPTINKATASFVESSENIFIGAINTLGSFASNIVIYSSYIGTISNDVITWGQKLYVQDAQGVILKDQSVNGNDGTLIGSILDTAWGTKIAEAEPMLHQKGGSKYLVNNVAGTIAHLASPDESNVGAEKVVNGGFDDGTNNWTPRGGGVLSVVSGALRITNDGAVYGKGAQAISVTNGAIYILEFDSLGGTSIDYRIRVGTVQDGSDIIANVIYNTNEHNTYTFIATTPTLYLTFVQDGTDTHYSEIDNVSIKEVDAIPAYGEWEFSIKHTNLQREEIYFINNNTDIFPNNESYCLRLNTNGYILFSRYGSGFLTLFQTSDNYLGNGTYSFKIIRTGNGEFSIYIKGGSFGETYILVDVTGGSGTNPITDNTYTSTKFIVADNDAGDEISHLSKDGYKYDVANFADGTGSYAVRNSIGLDYDASAYYRYDKLLCETAGTTAHLASPDESNVGVDQLGAWSPSLGWTENLDGSLTNDGSENNIFNVGIVGNSTYKLVEFEITEYTSGSVAVRFGGGGQAIHGFSGLGKIREFMLSGVGQFYFDPGGFIGTISNISVKEVTAIPAYGEWKFTMNKNSINVSSYKTFISSSLVLGGGNIESYQLRLDSSGQVFFRKAFTTLFTTALGYIDINVTYDYKIQRNSIEDEFFTSPVNWFRVLIKGGVFTEWIVVDTTGGNGTNPVFDDTYTSTKFLVVDNDAGDEISNISKDGEQYDVYDFVDKTGVYSVIPKAPDGDVDADLNPLEYPPNTMWNTGNKYKFPIGTEYSDIQQLQDKGIYIGTEPQEVDWDTVNSLEDDDDIIINKDVPNRLINNLKIK